MTSRMAVRAISASSYISSASRISITSKGSPAILVSRPTSRSAPSFRYRSYATTSSTPSKPQLNVPSSAGGPQAPLEYCASLVKRLDPDAWLCSYFWPKRERAWFLAWRAFNVCFPSIITIEDSCENDGKADMYSLNYI